VDEEDTADTVVDEDTKPGINPGGNTDLDEDSDGDPDTTESEVEVNA